MQTYLGKLQELGIEALEENKDAIKKALIESQLEIIGKAPQLLEKALDAVFSECECDDGEEE
jgi:hypothetical protein